MSTSYNKHMKWLESLKGNALLFSCMEGNRFVLEAITSSAQKEFELPAGLIGQDLSELDGVCPNEFLQALQTRLLRCKSLGSPLFRNVEYPVRNISVKYKATLYPVSFDNDDTSYIAEILMPYEQFVTFKQPGKTSGDALSDTVAGEINIQPESRVLETLLDSVPLPVVISHPEGNPLYANASLLGLLQTDFDTFFKDTRAFFVLPKKYGKSFDKLDTEGWLENSEVLVKTAENNYYWVLVSSARTRFHDQPAIISCFKDITEQYRTEQFLGKIINTLPDPVFVKDENLRYIEVNDSFCRFSGFERDKVIGSTVYDLTDEKQAKPFWTMDDEAIKTLEDQFEEFVMVDPSGHRRHISVRCSVFVDEVKRKMLVGVIRDITREKENALELEQAKVKAEQASLAKSRFLSQMSYALRTVLNSIIGFSELIAAEVFGPIEIPHYKTYAGDIRSSGRQLQKIIQNVLDYSDAETGELGFNMSVIDTNKLMQRVSASVFKPDGFGLHFNVDIADDLPPVMADPQRIHQFFQLLVESAVTLAEPEQPIIFCVFGDEDNSFAGLILNENVKLTPEELKVQIDPFGADGKASSLNQRYSDDLGLALAGRIAKNQGGTFRASCSDMGGLSLFFSFPPAN